MASALSGAVGGGFNAWYVGAVTETAYLMYRERFLIEKHGPEVAVPIRPSPHRDDDKGTRRAAAS